MKGDEKAQENLKKEENTTKNKVDSSRKLHLQSSCTEDSEALKNGKKQQIRRRKGASKPRRIQPVESKIVPDGRKSNSLDSVLKRVLKAKQSEEKTSLKESSTKKSTMMQIHETLAMHPHMPPNVASSTSPPGSVESPNSMYSNERPDDSLTETTAAHNAEPFVKVRPQSSGDISPELTSTREELHRSFSSDATLRKASLSPTQRFSKETRELAKAGRPSPPARSPPSNPNALVAMAAASMGLPKIMSTNDVLPGSIQSLLAMQQYNRRENFQEEEKKRFDTSAKVKNDNYPPNGHRIPSMPNGISLPNSNVSPPPTADMRAQYKRPPHTYPALIASAILDSPGNLITLRGIYDYIMNNFPYYKYCHDKSAWQNSIRHNLSLNQCFVKVPRYENAAKSNYWTMTREGFEEFGNENSFKRRRRRGASLAPISAYKAKKGQNDGSKSGKAKTEPRTPPSVIGSISNSVGAFPPHFMSLAAGGVWGPGLRGEEVSPTSRKRSHSPSENDTLKHPRMVVLKQGDGPALDGIKGDDHKRPSSLSSIEEMQGSLNYFSKSLLDPQSLSKAKIDTQSLTPASQPWITAAQKMAVPPALINVERAPTSPTKGASENSFNDGEPVMLEGIEIGKSITHVRNASEISVFQFQCRFCPYTYIGASRILLEQHSRFHPYEISNLKSTLQEKLPESPKESDQLMSLPNLLPGLTSRSMLAAAQSNAQNLLAAAQASAVGNSATGFPYSASFSTALLKDSVMRSIAEQMNANQVKVVNSDLSSGSMEAYVQRQQAQQAINNALQQAAAASTSQEQLRLLYQQFAMNNPFLSNTGAMFPMQQIPVSEADSNPFAQQILQYQQKILDQIKARSDKNEENIPSPRRDSNPDESVSVSRTESTSPRSSPQSTQEDSIAKKSIHSWKQCTICDFTAKGEHGLDLHYRKAHSRGDAPVTSSSDDVTYETSAVEVKMPPTKSEPASINDVIVAQKNGNMTSQELPATSLLNPLATEKRRCAPLDLSGIKDEDAIRKSADFSSTSTQTAQQSIDMAGDRTCRFCDITFGDEMMHALHMSCHDKADPFKCTICGQTCNEKYYFNVHLLRGLHQGGHSPISRQSSIEAVRSEGEASPRRHSNSTDSTVNRSRANSATNEVVY